QGRGAHSPDHAHHHKTTGQTWPHKTKGTPNEHHAMANPAAVQCSCVHRIKHHLPNGMATKPPRWGRGAHSPHHAHHDKTRPDTATNRKDTRHGNRNADPTPRPRPRHHHHPDPRHHSYTNRDHRRDKRRNRTRHTRASNIRARYDR